MANRLFSFDDKAKVCREGDGDVHEPKSCSRGCQSGWYFLQRFRSLQGRWNVPLYWLLFANGLAPKPDITKWFEGSSTDQLLGSNFIAPLMNKRLPNGGNHVPGIRRWRHFWHFLCWYDFHQNAKDAAAKDSLWKVCLVLHHLNKQARLMWVTGKYVSVDEQTIAFKGNLSMKLHISYKKEGDGFQCDAVCDRKYAFAFFFSTWGSSKVKLNVRRPKAPPHCLQGCLAGASASKLLDPNLHG